jgi:perosamine synthetase
MSVEDLPPSLSAIGGLDGQASWRIDELEHRYLKELLAGGFPGSSRTNFVGRFEEAFAAAFGTDYAITFVNGTATMHAALAAAGIGPRR